jgi:hypothetical protein
LNASTIKPNQPSTADYITADFKSGSKDKSTNNLLTADYHYFGSSYTSFGNPFVLNNLWAGSLKDQLDLLNRKIVLSGGYIFQENNVSAGDLATLRTQIINASAVLSPSPKLPQLTLFVNNELRNTPGSVLSNLVAANDNSLNLSGIINYNLKSGNTFTGINANYIYSSRADAINSFDNNIIQIASVGLSETFIKLNFGLDLRYATTMYSNPETPNTLLSNTYEARIRYELKKIKTNIAVGFNISQSNALALLGSTYSARDIYNISLSSGVIPGVAIALEAGLAPYTDLQYSSNSYQENYAIVRLTYNFDLKR